MTECSHHGSTSCTLPASKQVEGFLVQAETLCAQRKLRFTELRRRVLELVCGYDQPVGAYALLDDLRAEGRSAAPPTVYRALEFLLQQGLVHRLATNNRYFPCAHPQREHEAVFLVCEGCGHTQEIHTRGVIDVLKRNAKTFNFAVRHAAVEISGLCASCKH